MGGKKADKCLSGFKEADKQILIKIVKTAQARKVRGSKGDWKEFLAATDKKLGASMSDPVKRPWETLASFVQTFVAENDIQMVRQIRQWEKRRKRIEKLESNGFWGQSSEQELVRLTWQHRRYKELYTFPSYSEGWVMTKSGKANDSSSPERMISLDCEMVVCEHGERELVRVCAVDSKCKMLLDMLVKPTKLVVDYLTSITGVSEADLEGVTCCLDDAQREVMELLTPCTILVGHSLFHDLRALKIDHLRVIDTAFIFQYRNKPESYNAGLNDLCKAVLGHEFREDGKPHNCLDDAMIPMQIVLHTLEHGLSDPIDIAIQTLDEGQLSKLYLHSIPTTVSVNDLQDIFPKQYSCEIQDISSTKHNRTGTTFALFRSSDEANKAFKDLKGQFGRDSYGRPQKTVSISVLSGSGKLEEVFIKVRKMSNDEDDGGELLDTKNKVNTSGVLRGKRIWEGDDEDPSSNHQKKVTDSKKAQKREKTSSVSDVDFADEISDSNCSSHLQELESLRRQLRERDVEVQSLQRIIVALTRRQGL